MTIITISPKISMKRITLFLTMCLSGIVAVAADKPVLQMRLVLDDPRAITNGMVVTNRGDEIMTNMVKSASGGDHKEIVLVQKEILLDQSAVKSAVMGSDVVTGAPEIDLHLTNQGKQQFAEVTRKNIGRRLAIIVDGQISSAPVIREAIVGGDVSITGNFTAQEAQTMADKIARH